MRAGSCAVPLQAYVGGSRPEVVFDRFPDLRDEKGAFTGQPSELAGRTRAQRT